MLQDLGARLAALVEQKRLKKKLELDAAALETDLQAASARLTSLETQLAKEKVDVDKLERTGLTSLFYSVLGSREQQLDKERQELLAAELRYQQTKHQVQSLERERDHLRQQLDKLSGVEAAYEQVLSEKEMRLQQTGQTVAGELLELSEQSAHTRADLKEITEAISAGQDALHDLEKVIASLENAATWGAWDMLGGGLISTAIKHSRIDEARAGVNEVQAKMGQFKRELADIRKEIDLQIDISELDSFADFLFDGLIVDWIVQSKIEDSLTHAQNAKKLIVQTLGELERLKAADEKEHNGLQEKRALLIERA